MSFDIMSRSSFASTTPETKMPSLVAVGLALSSPDTQSRVFFPLYTPRPLISPLDFSDRSMSIICARFFLISVISFTEMGVKHTRLCN